MMRGSLVFRMRPCQSPGMTTHFQRLLKDQAGSPLFSGQGDGIKDGRYYLINGFDYFLASAAKAIVADGVDRRTIMKLFVNHALEVLDNAPGVTPPVKKQNAEQVLQYALALHSDFDDPKQAA